MEYGDIGGLLLLFILIDVALIERKLRRMMAEQERHNRAVEALLSEARDRPRPTG